MDLVCAACGDSFEATRSSARYCSPRCRQHGKRTKDNGGEIVEFPGRPNDEREYGDLEKSLVIAFTPDDLITPAGMVALRLAVDVDGSSPRQPGYAALVLQYRQAIDDLTAQAKPKVVNPLTLLRERRDLDRASGTA